jgi:hypothetical protein
MNLNSCMTVANEPTLIETIKSAEHRLVVMAPALPMKVAMAIVGRWRALGSERVVCILDTDPEVYRLGYGDFDALPLLEQTAAELGTMLQRHAGVRIGLVISDERTLIYSPTPRLIEADPNPAMLDEPVKPNAIRIDQVPAEVERDLGTGPEGIREQRIGLNKATRANLIATQTDLKTNPPLKFDVARQIVAFNAYFEFVELEMSGVLIERRTVPLPTDLVGLADDATRSKLMMSFRMALPEDDCSSRPLMEDRRRIEKWYLRSIRGYGKAILRSHKPAFLKDVDKLGAAVEAYGRKVQLRLRDQLEHDKAVLTHALYPSCRRKPPKRWTESCLFEPEARSIRQFIHEDLDRCLKKLIDDMGQMTVSVRFKAVTYEALRDPKFMENARHAFPEMKALHSERQAAPAVASRLP